MLLAPIAKHSILAEASDTELSFSEFWRFSFEEVTWLILEEKGTSEQRALLFARLMQLTLAWASENQQNLDDLLLKLLFQTKNQTNITQDK
jgi:hypothetical protein